MSKTEILYLNDKLDSIARLFAADYDCILEKKTSDANLGTCFYIGNQLFLTARHCLYTINKDDTVNYDKIKKFIFINFKDEGLIPAKFFACSSELDIAIIKIDEKVINKEPLSLVDKEFIKIKKLQWESFGFPIHNEYREIGFHTLGTQIRKAEYKKQFDLTCTMNKDFTLENFKGFSGAPIIDENGVIAIIVKHLNKNNLAALSINNAKELFEKNNICLSRRTLLKDKYNIKKHEWNINNLSRENFKILFVQPFKKSKLNSEELLSQISAYSFKSDTIFETDKKNNSKSFLNKKPILFDLIIFPESFFNIEEFINIINDYLKIYQVQDNKLGLLHFGLRSNDKYKENVTIDELNFLLEKLIEINSKTFPNSISQIDIEIFRSWLYLLGKGSGQSRLIINIIFCIDDRNQLRFCIHPNFTKEQEEKIKEVNILQYVKIFNQNNDFLNILPLTSRDLFWKTNLSNGQSPYYELNETLKGSGEAINIISILENTFTTENKHKKYLERFQSLMESFSFLINEKTFLSLTHKTEFISNNTLNSKSNTFQLKEFVITGFLNTVKNKIKIKEYRSNFEIFNKLDVHADDGESHYGWVKVNSDKDLKKKNFNNYIHTAGIFHKHSIDSGKTLLFGLSLDLNNKTYASVEELIKLQESSAGKSLEEF